MFSGESPPPCFSALMWSMTYPGRAPVAVPVAVSVARTRMLSFESDSRSGTALYPAAGRSFAGLAVVRGVPARVAWQRPVVGEGEDCGENEENASHTSLYRRTPMKALG